MNVSVVIPCHNAESYVAQAIGSALDQTYAPHEVIIVDDGSTDDSLKVACDFWALHRDRVKVLSERSEQASRTRNIGAAAASGDALLFLDADDVIRPDTLQALVEALTARPDGIAVCPWYRLASLDGRWVRRPPSCPPRRPADDALSAWLTGWYHPPCSVLWSTDAFERAGRWDEVWNPNDDGDLMMRALVYDVPLVETNAGAGFYRRLTEKETSLSDRRSTAEGVLARTRTVRKIAHLLEEQGRIRSYHTQIQDAFRLITDSAVGIDSDLRARIDAYRRPYEPPFWTRATGRKIRRLGLGMQRLRSRIAKLIRDPVKGGQCDPDADVNARKLDEVTLGLENVTYGLKIAKDVAAAEHGRRESGAAPCVVHLDRPAVSVVIPTFDRGHVLPRAIESVLAQKFDDYELLIVDDGSTDDTDRVVATYSDERIHYLAQPVNRGVANARNLGLRAARGEFIAFLDSDDEWMPDKLERQVRVLRESPPEVALVYTGVESAFEDGSRSVERPTRRGNVFELMLLKNVIHGGGSNVLIRRNVVATVGFFDESFPAIEDYDYWLRISRFYEVDFVETPLVRYHDARLVAASQPERKSLAVPDNFAARRRLFRKHRNALRAAGVAHLFHLDTARRYLIPTSYNVWGARRAILRAIFESPTSQEAHKMLRRTFIPSSIRQFLVTGRRLVRGADSA